MEKALGMNLDQYLNYFDEETLRILGQMDAPSQILDFLYLGSEWNASNLEELQRLGWEDYAVILLHVSKSEAGGRGKREDGQ